MGVAARGASRPFPGIESILGVCGGAPVIAGMRIPVWLLEEARRQGTTDAELLHAYPTLRPEDLANTRAHVRSHRAEIDVEIEANEANDAA